jgi:hypothetical protein
LAQRHSRTDRVLVAVAFLLVVLWFTLSRRSNTLDEGGTFPFAKLEGTPAQTLTLTSKDATVTIRRESSTSAERRFIVQNPVGIPADEAAIDRLHNTLSTLEVLRDVPKPYDLANLGLLSPQLRITFTQNNASVTVSLGHHSQSPDTGRYAQLESNGASRVVVLSPATTAALNLLSPEGLIEHRLIELVPSEVSQVTIYRNNRRIELAHLETGRFELANTPRYRTKRDKSEALLLALTNLTVERYLDAKNATSDLGPTPITVVLKTVSELASTPTTLSFGSPCPGDPTTVFVSLSGTDTRCGCVKKQVVDLLPNEENELLDDHIFFLHTDEIEKLTFESQNKRLVIERRGAAFQLLEPDSQEVGLETGNAVLDSLVAVRGTPLGPCQKHFENSTFKLTLRSGIVGQKGFTDEVLLVGPMLPNGERNVCRDDGQAFLVKAAQASSVELDRAVFQSPRLLDAPYDSVDEVTITRQHGVERIKRDALGHLTLIEPKLPGDTASIESLAERLAQLSAERWLTPSAVFTLQPETTPRLVKFWFTRESNTREEHLLRVFRTKNKVTIARLDDRELSFVLPDTTAVLLDGLLVDKSAYRFTENDRSFSLSRNNRTIRCTRTVHGFTCPSLRLSDSSLRQRIEPIAQLRAARVDEGVSSPRGDTLIFRVYETSEFSTKPRFVLTLTPPLATEQERLWRATADGSNVTMRYRQEDVEPILRLFDDVLPHD